MDTALVEGNHLNEELLIKQQINSTLANRIWLNEDPLFKIPVGQQIDSDNQLRFPIDLLSHAKPTTPIGVTEQLLKQNIKDG